MHTTGLFVIHNYTIPIQYNKPIRLIFFGDVHRDSPTCAEGKWNDFLAYSRRQKNAWFFGMGDYLDSTSASERNAWAMACLQLHETKKDDVEKHEVTKCAKFAKEIEFMKGRLIGLLGGNHYFQFQNGTNTDHKICERMDCKFMGVSSFTRLTLDCYGRRHTLDIWAHHGLGGARLVGGSINRVDQMREHAEADIYAMGHDHGRMAIPAKPRMLLSSHGTELHLRERQQWLLRTGSFLASYVEGVPSYNVDAGRGPSSLGHVELEITVKNSDVKDIGRKNEIEIRGIN